MAARPWRIVWRVLRWTLLSIVAIVLLSLATVFIGLRTERGSRALTEAGLRIARKYLAAEITIGALHTNLLHDVVLENVELRDIEGQTAARADRVAIRYSPWSLLRGKLQVASVEVTGGHGIARSLADGRINFAALVRPRPPEPPQPEQALSTFRIEVDQVRADLIGRYQPPPDIQLTPFEGRVKVEARVIIVGSTVSVEVRSLDIDLGVPSQVKLLAHGGLTVERGELRFSPTHIDLETAGSTLQAFTPTPALRGRYRIVGDAAGALAALAIKARVDTPASPIFVDGGIEVANGFRWHGRVQSDGLDPGKLLADVPHAAVTLDASGRGDGATGHIALAHAGVDVNRNQARVKGSFDYGATLAADLEVDLEARDLSRIRGAGVPRLAGAVTGRTRVRWSPRSIRLDSDLSGRSFSLPGLAMAAFTLHAHTENASGKLLLEARDLRSGALRLVYARAEARGDKRAFSLRVDANGNAGTSFDLALRGTPRFGAGPLPIGVDAILEVLDLDRNGERWQLGKPASFTYDGSLRVRGFSLHSQTQTLAIDGLFDPATRRISAMVRGASLDLHRLVALVADAASVPRSNLNLVLKIDGSLDRPRLDLALSGTAIRHLEQRDAELRGRIDVHLDPEHVTAKSELDLDGSRVDFDLDAPAVFDLRALLRSVGPLKLHLSASTPSLSRFYQLVGWQPPSELSRLDGKLSWTIALDGTARAPTLHTTVEGEGLVFGQMAHNDLKLTANYVDNRLDTGLDLTLRGESSSSKAGTVHVQASLTLPWTRLSGQGGSWLDRLGRRTPVAARVRVDGFDLAQLPRWGLGLPSAVDAGVVDASVDVEGPLTAPILHASVRAKDVRRGPLERIGAELVLDSARQATRLTADLDVQGSRLFRLEAQGPLDLAWLVARGDPRTVPLQATLTTSAFDLATLAKLVPGLAGKLSGSVHASGSIAVPNATAQFDIDSLVLGANQFAGVSLTGRYGNSALHAELQTRQQNAGWLSLSADWSFQKGAQQPLALRLFAKGFRLDFESLDDSLPIHRLKGVLDANMTATGSIAAPRAIGSLRLSGGALAIAGEARELTDIELQLSLEAGALKLDKLSAKVGVGRVSAHGIAKLVGLRITSLDVFAETKQLLVVQTPISAAVDAKIEAHGELHDGALTGTVRIYDGSTRLPPLMRVRELQSTGALDDYVYVDRKARAAAARQAKTPRGDAFKLLLTATLPGPFHVRSQELDVDLKGEIVVKALGSQVSLRGSVESTGGRIELFGRRYTIEEIRVGFDGSPRINPSLDVKLTRQLANALIRIELTGSAAKPRLILTSSPPIYDESEIIAIVLSGDPSRTQVTDRSLNSQVAGVVSGLVVSAIKDQLVPQLPFDVIKVDVGGTDSVGATSARLEIGRYLSDHVYVSYAHQFGATQIGTRKLNANEGNLEYRFLRSYSLDFIIGDAPSGRVDLFWTLRR